MSKKQALLLEEREQAARKVLEKYHFAAEDEELLQSVARQLWQAAEGKAGFWFAPQRREGSRQELVAAMTLGAEVDRLQEAYSGSGRLLECYMAEMLAGELLMRGYAAFERCVLRQTGRYVADYRFFGGEDCPLEGIREALCELGTGELRCNSAFCLIPKKSVVFLAGLTEQEKLRCAGVCAGCARRDCPNRSGGKSAEPVRWPDLAGRPLPYGYMRILEKRGG
ncbi:MAG: hypothetical protein Q4C65_01500 [Eubacteriales bacterium]|nr:hypothetical protein [Eubacteriales bacterium]